MFPLRIRQDVITECLHTRILHSSLVSRTPALKCGADDNIRVSFSEPTVFENYVHDLYVDEQLVELSLWDTAGTRFYMHDIPQQH